MATVETTLNEEAYRRLEELIVTLEVAPGSVAYTAPVIDSRHRNRMVRGEPARFARVEAGRIELPPDFSAGYSGIYSLQDKRG